MGDRLRPCNVGDGHPGFFAYVEGEGVRFLVEFSGDVWLTDCLPAGIPKMVYTHRTDGGPIRVEETTP